jgi:hypothetical protein
LVEILHLENGCFIPKGDFRGIQDFNDKKICSPQSPLNSPFNWQHFTFMAKNTIKGGRAKNNATALATNIKLKLNNLITSRLAIIKLMNKQYEI